jgi:hypothetical protein
MGLNYNPTIVPDGLILYLDPANSRSYSGSGNTWYDLSGNSLNATLVNSPSYTVSNRGTFVLDGSSNYFTLPNNSILSLSEFTISIWVKALQLNADQYLVDTSSNLNYGYGYSFRIRSNNTIRFWAYDANTLVDTTDTITSNVWYHITVSYSNFTKTQKIYINGSLSASAQHTNAFVLADPQYLRIGHSQVLGGYSKAVIGQSMFYNRELSASEIKQNYDASKGRFLTPENIVTNGLVLYVDSSKSNSYAGFGNTIYDLSSSGNTGILTDGPAFSGLNDGSIVFDGVDDYINFGNNSTLQQNSGTLSAWVKASSPGSVYRGIIAKRLAYGLFYLNSVLIAYDWVANTARSTGINIADNTWKNVVLTYQSGVSNGTSIYINGVSVLTTTITIYDQTANLYGGAEANATQFASCQASSFSMYNRALTQQEILQNYNATKSRFGL